MGSARPSPDALLRYSVADGVANSRKQQTRPFRRRALQKDYGGPCDRPPHYAPQATAATAGDELMDTLKLALHCVDPPLAVRPEKREEGGAAHVPASSASTGDDE